LGGEIPPIKKENTMGEIPTLNIETKGFPLSFEALIIGALLAKLGGKASITYFELMNVKGITIFQKGKESTADDMNVTVEGAYYYEEIKELLQNPDNKIQIVNGVLKSINEDGESDKAK
jgi:hypothetical protein